MLPEVRLADVAESRLCIVMATRVVAGGGIGEGCTPGCQYSACPEGVALVMHAYDEVLRR
jgi:hypothetical protein